MIAAAWLHDIARYEAKKEHNIPEKVEEVLKKCDGYDKLSHRLQDILEIVSAHKGEFEPKKNILECAVLRVCEKLDKINENETSHKKAQEKYEESLEEVKDCFDKMYCELDAFYCKKIEV